MPQTSKGKAALNRMHGRYKNQTRNVNAKLIHKDRKAAGKSVSDLADDIGMSSVVLSFRLKNETLTDAQCAAIETTLGATADEYKRGS